MPDCCYIDVLGCLWAGMLVRMGFGLDIQEPLGCVGGSGLLVIENDHFHNFHDFLGGLLVLENDYPVQGYVVVVGDDFHAVRDCVKSVSIAACNLDGKSRCNEEGCPDPSCFQGPVPLDSSFQDQ